MGTWYVLLQRWHLEVAVVLGFLLDLLLGDPEHWFHPVRLIGGLVRELERRLARVRKKRASYQRKIIGTAVVFFIILIIVCALLPGEDNTASEKWEKPVNDRQTKVLQSLQDNFK